MSETITTIQLGLFGGLARTLFSTIKVLLNRKRVDAKAFFLLIFLNVGSGALLGGVLGAYANISPILAALVGYASFDLWDSGNKLLKLNAVKIGTGTIGIKSVKKTVFEEAMEMK